MATEKKDTDPATDGNAPVARFVNELYGVQKRWAGLASESGEPLEQHAVRALTTIIAALAFGDEKKLEALAVDAAKYRRDCVIRDRSKARHALAKRYAGVHQHEGIVEVEEEPRPKIYGFRRTDNFALPSRADFLTELRDILEMTAVGGRPLADAMTKSGNPTQRAFLIEWLQQHWACIDPSRECPSDEELSEALDQKGQELGRRKAKDRSTGPLQYIIAACLNAAGVSDEDGRALKKAKDWIRSANSL